MRLSQEQADRIEQKLDRIIDFFNIGAEPRRPDHELDQLADKIILDLHKRSKRRKRKV